MKTAEIFEKHLVGLIRKGIIRVYKEYPGNVLCIHESRSKYVIKTSLIVSGCFNQRCDEIIGKNDAPVKKGT